VDGSDVLIVIAELAVGLAGFSGVVVTLGRRSSAPWQQDEKLRFNQLLGFALGCAFFAILPLALMLSPLQVETIVQVCGIPAALLFGAIVTTTVVRISRLNDELRANFNVAFSAFLFVGTLCICGVGLVNAFGVFTPPSVWLYVIVLVWALLVSGLQFLRIVILGMTSTRGAA
jgi:hypothetical protein